MGSEDRLAQPPPDLHDGHNRDVEEPKGFWRSRSTIVLLGFFLMSGLLLVSEHRLHALGYLPYLLVLACPLMHIFHHGGHGGHGAHKPGRERGGSQRR
ncbi:DUF2933 domain-containing protein [Ensifer sesbaniae]|uniref:DUF2933 domain-containing protein n=1 Tax=Ensifer sesbaniae TaxID=1214071 RepID=UPI002000AB9D|nr:DUF2933 domain-containing protein [Ensifer sesbaniae]